MTAYNSDEKLEIQDILDQLLQTVNPVAKVGTLFEYAAAAVLNYRLVLHLKNYLSLSRPTSNILFTLFIIYII